MNTLWTKLDFWDILDTYEVSTNGEVRNYRKGNIRKSHHDKYGYKNIVLYDKNIKKKNFKVHRLVAKAFLDNPNNYPEVNHIDGVQDNNYIENLEWCTGSQNQIHARNTGLMTKLKVNLNDVRVMCLMIQDNKSTRYILDYFGIGTKRENEAKFRQYVRRIHAIKSGKGFKDIFEECLLKSSTTIETTRGLYIHIKLS